MITHATSIDMYPSSVPKIIHLSQYDEDFSLVFTLYSSVGTFTLESGTTAAIRGTKNDGKGYSVDASIDISSKTVTVTGNKQMTAVAGKNVFELTLMKNNKELNTANFILDVERAALDQDTVPSESVIKEIYEVADKLDNIDAVAGSLEEIDNLADNLGEIGTVNEHLEEILLADDYALASEGYALGTQEGVDVSSTSPYYHNNSKYFADVARINYGSPLSASVAADMTELNRVYVYTGSESGYLNGHWYYWNGTAWTDGGVYNATRVNTDTTLSVAGEPADAKATGDALSGKQDKVSGKGLSTNDYTTDEKNKLAGIETGAEVNVQSDWNQTDTSADDYIKNKPTLGTAAAKDVGVANGVAGLDGAGKVPSSQLPSYVDDVIEGYYYNGAFYSDSSHTTQITAETGKIYVDLSTDTTYRWTGSIYVQISNPIDIDATLTQPGKAADAKATGDAIAQSGKVNTVNSIQPDGNKNVQTVIELTQAQYDALATKDPNVVYYITDGSVDYPTASTIPYDNTDSGLTADTVQGAIDEVQGEIGNTSMGTTATTLTGAIAEHESDISTLNDKLTFVNISSNSYKATSTNYEYVGCSITVPTGRAAIVQCVAIFNAGAPVGIALTSSNSNPSNANVRFVQEFPDGFRSGYSSAVFLTEGTYYMWVKRNSVPTAANNHAIRGFIF